jgi:hypothetical protein
MMDERHERTGMIRERRVWLPVLVLGLLGFALYLPRLSASGLWDPWEPKYVQTAREMAAKSEWIIPQYRHDERLNKAPLTYWVIAASHALFGVNETGARLPSAVLAVFGAAALGFAFAARGRPLEGCIAGAALLTSPQWALTGRFATPDMPLASCLGIALALVVWSSSAEWGRKSRVRAAVLVVLVAAAALADWPRGLLLPLWAVLGWGALRWTWKGPLALVAVAALYHAAQMSYSVPLNLAAAGMALVLAALVLRVRGGVSLPVMLVGVVTIAVLVAPWFLVAYHMEPDEMSVFRYKYAFNLGETEREHTGSYDYIIRSVAIGGLPWSSVAVVGLIAAVWRRRDPAAGVLGGAWLGAMLFFTLSEAQMGHFYAVIQPAVAGLAGIGAAALVRRPGWQVVPAAGALLAVWFVAWQQPSRILETATVKSHLYHLDLTLILTVVVLAWTLALIAARLRGRESWALASVVPAAVFVGYLGMHVVPELEPMKSFRPMWRSYLARSDGAEPIGLYGPVKDTAFYYSDNAIDRLKSFEEVEQFLAGGGTRFLIARTTYARPMREIAGTWQIVDRTHPTHWLHRFEPGDDPEKTTE